MFSIAATALLLLSALIHVLPLSGVLSADRLEALYGVPIADPNVVLAMRHRAVLFGLLGALLVVAALEPSLRPTAIAGALVSDLAFLVLALVTDGTNDKMRRVFIADVVSIGCLVLVAAHEVFTTLA